MFREIGNGRQEIVQNNNYYFTQPLTYILEVASYMKLNTIYIFAEKKRLTIKQPKYASLNLSKQPLPYQLKKIKQINKETNKQI